MENYESFSLKGNINLLENIQLEASAGTGKTFSIERIVTLLIARNSMNISNILIVTFTKKAARELKERIREILFQSYHNRELDLGDTIIPLNEYELENIHKSYIEFEKASIFTIHSFCLNMLKAYPFESLSQFSMEMEKENDLTDEAVWDYMREIGHSMEPGQLLKYKAYMDGRSFADAVSALSDAVDKELLEPDVELIPDEDFISEVLNQVTDFNNEEGDLYHFWKTLIHNLPDLNDLNDLGFKRAKDKMKKISMLEAFAEEKDFMSINRGLCKEKIISSLLQFLPEYLDKQLKKGIDSEYVRENIFVQNVENFLNYYQVDHKNPENNIYKQTLRAEFLFESYFKIKEHVNRKKDITGKLDFNDLIGKLHRALCGTEKFRQPELIGEIRKRYQTVLVDEFQDTDSRQWDIFNTLFGQDKKHNFFLVGDPKQSIYGFRGADLEIYYKACSGNSVYKRFTLDKNFRSISTLVEAVNILFSKVFHKNMHCGETVNTPFNDVQAGRNNSLSLNDGKPPCELIRVETLMDRDKGITNLKKGKEFYFKLISYKIFGLLNEKTQLKDKNVKPGDIAVLTESNKDCQTIQNQLSAYSIPSVITARENIFNTVEASEFLILLQALVKMDNSSVKLLLLSIFFELSSAEIEKLELTGTLDIFSGQLYHWREAIDNGKIIEVCYELFNYRNLPGVELTFEQRILLRKNGERYYTNVRQILEYLHREQNSSRLDTEELYSLLSHKLSGSGGVEEDLLRLDKDSEAVQIMTMHASKGLEFPIVFFAGAMKKDMRSSVSEMYNYVRDGKRYYDFIKYDKNKINQSMDLWEERKRLYYVALTRASSKMYLPYIQNGDLSYLSSLYSSFCIDDIKSQIVDNPQVSSFSLPIHSGLKSKGDVKKNILETIDNSVKRLVDNHISIFCINDEIEKEYLQLDSNQSLIYDANIGNIPLRFIPLKNQKGFLDRYRKISSYSSIIRDKSVKQQDIIISDDADRDEVNSPVVDKSSEVQILTRGAVLGELVHQLFELLDYEKVEFIEYSDFFADEEVEILFKALSVRFFNNNWYIKFGRQLKTLVYQSLKNEIKPGFSLSQLKGAEKLHEMEFHIMVKECGNLILDSFKGSVENGFLKGFIDLIFQYEGKYYIADWKTTSSPEGDDYESYNIEVLDHLMDSHHYKLQSMIYMVALCKFLNRSQNDQFNYDRDFGGCYYLFVRGMTGQVNSGTGIHFYRPDKGELLSFADQFTTLELVI